jgi:putative transposase
VKPKRVHNFGTYFVSTQSWGRRALFRVDELAKLFVDTLYDYRSRRSFLLHEFVVMPDHLHVIITPQGITLERAMQLIKGGYSYAVGKTGRVSLEIWQPGFSDHRIRDEADYLRHREYIYQNPVCAGLCVAPEEFEYSSANPKYELDKFQISLGCSAGG